MLERNTKAAAPTIPEIAAQYDRVALVFQGGGALGAYQAGVYEALAEAGCEPTWLSGVSIGAVNAAIIAGNEPGRRLQRLEQFWQIISGRKIWAYTPEGDFFRDIRNRTSSWMTMTMGQPGFFKPRFPNPWLELPGAEGATSFYDSAELKKTLEMLIDFDVLNDGKKRFSVGAVNVRTGNFVYFDTDNIRIGPEHIMASGALPPALPSIRIEGEYYWDGGIVSNTPLQYLLDQEEDRSSLVFQVDLFSARGVLPRSMPDVLSRHKDIMYSSRTRQNTDNFKRIHGLKMKLLGALKRVPRDQLTAEEEELIADYSDAGVVNIVHLIYQHKNYEGHAKDYEFSGTSMREHWDMGLEDTKRTLRHTEWLLPPFTDDAVAIHDLHREDPA
ncbi:MULTISPECIES: patatin-like phospholipase family protein [Rhizobium]|uniref:NTE family protein n=1 Tax=Rhizobium tropici TaxID=398 RepID=A0A6P1CE52_RHITR|nr:MULTISPECIES: patatin-like phospholipase family protein [Rhizobium]AGB75309.1 phospholipase, patatin family [Rhizobium tropici CIAT 899]MBB4245578.1 NTE family protein [Rhizobium tropici]MBB5596861.1 NTE family protein [Rhizobium tropici]MBB6495907.1 NTE family protein [Rhizobium tropici]NEV15370.1 patatin-like phospholipase family protein [Rhizobium tropici]